MRRKDTQPPVKDTADQRRRRAQAIENGVLCDCGKPMSVEAAEFWGECVKCRLILPLRTFQTGDGKGSGGHSDREYHGGMGSRGEW